MAPYDDPSWAIWTASPNNKGVLPRVDAWYELHSYWFLTNARNKDWTLPYLAFLRTLPLVYMQEVNDLVPLAVKFSKDEIVAEFGHAFFTSAATWMLAKAIYEKADEIALYGLDMTAEGEWEYERPGAQYFIRIARQRGVRVTIPPQSDLDVPTPLYGYGDSEPIAIKMLEHAFELRARMAGFDKRIAAIETERSQLMVDKAYLQGALDNNIHIRRAWFAWSGPDTG